MSGPPGWKVTPLVGLTLPVAMVRLVTSTLGSMPPWVLEPSVRLGKTVQVTPLSVER